VNREFKHCIDNKKIIHFESGNKLVRKELAVALDDLSDAKDGFNNQRYKWSTIQAYYAMFHSARALVYSQGYREKSHYCLFIALKALFVDEDKLDTKSVRDYINCMNLRESADYEAEFSEDGAKSVIVASERFIEKAKKILNAIGTNPELAD